MKTVCRFILSLLLGGCLVQTSAGQYAGGQGDGHDRTPLHNIPLDGSNNPSVTVFRGASGDGQSRAGLFNWALDGANNPSPLAFRGGPGDGAAQARLSNLPLDGSNAPPESPFRGMTGDGHGRGGLFNWSLDASDAAHPDAFRGASGDGHGTGALHNRALDGTGALSEEAYRGGRGDGFGQSVNYSLSLSGPPLVYPFLGGRGDGFGSGRFFNRALDGAELAPAAFLGGAGDGFARASVMAWPMAPNPVMEPFLGGSGDGHGSARLSNVPLHLNPPPVALIGVSGTTTFCGEQVLFSGASSYSVSNSIASYHWEFGDWASALGVAVAHAYGGFGTYTARLTVVDHAEPPQSGSRTILIRVLNRPPVSNPGGPYWVKTDAPVTLDGSASSDPDAPWGDAIVQYEWGFGVAGPFAYTSATPAFVTAFAEEGTHTVRLRVTDTQGGTHTASAAVVARNAGYLGLAQSQVVVPENNPTLLVTVVRTNGTYGAVAADYYAVDGTAVAGVDYVAAGGTVFFAEGQDTATVPIGIIDNEIADGERTFTVQLANLQGWARAGTQTNLLVRIEDDDVPGVLNLAQALVRVQENAGQAVLRVERSAGAMGTVTVQYATADGTALAGSDYLATAGVLTLGPNVFNASVAVPIIDDDIGEGLEHFTFRIHSPGGGAVLGVHTEAVVEIVDDDRWLGFTAARYPVTEGVAGGAVTLTVRRHGGTDEIVGVDFHTEPGTATAGADYTPVSGRLAFAIGQDTATIQVPIHDDDVLGEPVETFLVHLSNPSPGISLGAIRSARVEITDNDKVLLQESFENGQPAGWLVKANAHPANIWRFDNPGGRANRTGGSGRFAIADSDALGNDGSQHLSMDTELVTPVLRTSGLTEVKLRFRSDFYYIAGYGAEKCDVDVSANGHKGPWTRVWRLENASHRGPSLFELDLSPWLANRDQVAIRFRYHGAQWDYWWQVDDVLVTGRSTDAGLPGRLALSASTLEVAENSGQAVITVLRFGGTAGTVGGTLATVAGTATPGEDYIAFNGPFSIPSGQASVSIPITILDDDLHEGHETFTVRLSTPTGGATLGQPVEQLVTILDDEGLLTDLAVALEAPPDPLLTRGDIDVRVTAVNHGPSPATGVQVEIELPPEAAYAGTVPAVGHAVQAGGLVRWAVDRLEPFEQAEAVITCRFPQEGLARFAATIGGAESDPVAGNNQVAIERQVLSTGTLGFSAPSYEMAEDGPSILIDVIRMGGTLGPATVAYATSDGTATAGEDYVPVSGVLFFDDGEVLKQILLTPIDDDLIEGTEYFHVSLSAVSGAALGQDTAVVTIRDDDTFHMIAASDFEGQAIAAAGDLTGMVAMAGSGPFSWTVHTPGGADGWRFDDPGGRGNQTGGAGGFAIADSSHAGGAMETELRSPVYDLQAQMGAVLAFKTELVRTQALAQVLVSTNGASGPWTMLWDARDTAIPGPGDVVIDLRQAAGQASVAFSFRYSSPDADGWWAVDDVTLHGEEDLDGDGLPDWWEILHFGSIEAQDGDDDSDRDGASNRLEFLAGTHPGDAADHPGILGISMQEGKPVLHFRGVPSRLYDVESALHPGGAWEVVVPSVPGNGNIQALPVEEPGVAEPPVFFRLRIRPY